MLGKVAGGDERAFSLLIAQFSTIVYRYLIYWLKEPQLVEEIAQDVFTTIWQNRHKLPEINNFKGYLYITTRNKAFTELKRHVLRATSLNNDVDLAEIMIQPHPTLELKELSSILKNALDALPPRRKEIFNLSRTEGLTYDAIAERLNISRGTVKDHMVAALLFLRQYVSERAGITISHAGTMLFIDFLVKN